MSSLRKAFKFLGMSGFFESEFEKRMKVIQEALESNEMDSWGAANEMRWAANDLLPEGDQRRAETAQLIIDHCTKAFEGNEMNANDVASQMRRAAKDLLSEGDERKVETFQSIIDFCTNAFEGNKMSPYNVVNQMLGAANDLLPEGDKRRVRVFQIAANDDRIYNVMIGVGAFVKGLQTPRPSEPK